MKNVTPTSLVLAYYDNPEMLKTQFEWVRKLPAWMRDAIGVVVVDDGSPRWPARPEEIGCPLQIYRMREDRRWNQDACRNAGVAHAETDWVLMTDMDHLVPEDTWKGVLMMKGRDPQRVYKFSRVSLPDLSPYKIHPNSWLMTRKKFDEIGGYDERFSGCYGSDAPFRDGVLANAGEPLVLKEALVRVPREVIPDASTTTYLRKQPEDRAGMARVRTQLSKLPPDQRRPLRGLFKYDRVYP